MDAAGNIYLTNVHAGSPMGKLLRSYWIPLCYSDELAERDGPPVRVRLLGESLVAFRDSDGRIGLLDHHCPHRLASLFYGRNEEGGLRCVYHGWKFDVEGQCLDMPNEPVDCPLQRKVRAIAYPCREANGIVWAYMGDRKGGELPPLPGMGWALAPPERKSRLRYLRRCNWVQAMEGDFDSSHLGFLHSKLDTAAGNGAVNKANETDALRPMVLADRRPMLDVEDTPVGVMYGAGREAGGGDLYWRVTQFQLPFYTSVPAYGGLNRLKIWVPMDDEHVMIWEANWSPDRDLDADERKGHHGRVGPSGFLADTDGWHGRGNFAARAENDYLIDRVRQKTHNFTGMEDETPIQDAAMQESMGDIVDRTREHLSASDAAIIRMRRRLMLAAEALETKNEIPPGVDDSGLYNSHGDQMVIRDGGCWKSGFAQLMAHHYGAGQASKRHASR